MTTANASRYPAEYSNSVPLLCGQSLSWLKQQRTNALLQFSEQGFPALHEEEWRYTNISAIEKKLFSPKVNKTTGFVDVEWLKSYQLEDAWSVVLVDGHFSAELSSLEGLPNDVLVKGMADALEEIPEVLERLINQAVSVDEHSFIAFNTAWFTDGLFVHLSNKQVLERPIQVLHIATQQDVLSATRTVIILDKLT